MRVMVTTNSNRNRNYSMYMNCLRDMWDLESDVFREHWYYRTAMFRINTNLWKEHAHLTTSARAFMEGKNHVEKNQIVLGSLERA